MKLTEKQVMKIHEIIERHSTDVVDYELATDDINAYLLAVPSEPQPESVSAQGNKQVFMCGCISYNTALVPRCPIHKQASEPR